jgi:tol-pal system protein YbgF
MIRACQRNIAICIACLLPFMLRAEAPVVDESDHFATYDQQPAADDQPLAREHTRRSVREEEVTDSNFDDEKPLARDTTRPGSNNNASLLGKVQNLQQELQELRGQLEVQGHELKLLKDQQLAFYKDLDARLHNTTSSAPATISTNSSAQPASPPVPPNHTSAATAATPSTTTVIPVSNHATQSNNPADEQIRYLAAYDLIKAKRFDDAITAMQSFINQYPKGGYTANAHYWLGELYMTQKNYPDATTQFTAVLQQFPSSSKAAPSQLKLAYALASSGKKQDAMVQLKQIIKQYPDTHTAKLAENKLISLNR